ncbi:MAG: hypothetical protein ABUL42_03070 [Terricaulis silvestris]
MTAQENPVVTQYMARFEAALGRFRLPEAREIAMDVRSHIAEAQGYGKSLDEVLATLGPADALARAYAVELLMDAPKNARGDKVMRFFQLLAIVIAGSFLSLIVATIFGGFGISFALAGMILIVGGGLEALGVHLAHVQTGGLPPLATMALGPVAFAIAWGCFWLLGLYVKAAARAVRRMLPTHRKAAA